MIRIVFGKFLRALAVVSMLAALGLYLSQRSATSQLEPIVNAKKIDKVIVKKSLHRLYLMHNNKIIQEYHVVFGGNPKGHKVQEGDARTPEGRYILDYKRANSSFYRAIHISYPNQNDRVQAKKLGLNAGGAIMIHGQKNGLESLSFFAQLVNWTDGCIALNNDDMRRVYSMVDSGTPIEIVP